ncbi:uncharacterized protein At4g18490-like [Euphorbia lathyris]|uniref:uncharacterized protein At4g18490-like n=1 Tax=Euphorbia lathyris TaxID=212925 RepID=UPI003313BE82
MEESRKETPSSLDPKEKKSSFDDEIGKDFYGSWKLLSDAVDPMDFSFDTVPTGKKISINFGKSDPDFNLDGAFDKLTSFKVDMPDLDVSCPSKKTAKPKESSKGESSGGSHQGKPDSFNFSFDFNDRLDDAFNFGSTLTEGKNFSEKNSSIKDDGAARIEQQGSKLKMAGCSDAFDDCQTDNLPASDNVTAPTVKTTTDCAGTRDASNIGELVLTYEVQTSPQKSLSVSPKDKEQQIYLDEKENFTEPVAPDTTQVLPAQSFDGNDSTQATESDTEIDTPAPEVNTESVVEQNVTHRKIDVLRSDPDNSQLKISDPPHNNESGSNRAESEKAHSETPAGNMIGTAPVQDDDEVTSAATLSRTRSHSDTSKNIQMPALILLAPLRSEHVVDKIMSIKKNKPEVGSSKISQTSNETEPQLCQPSSVDGQVSSAVNKGPATSYPANGKREGIFVNDAETQRKLTGDLKSLSKELIKGEPAFLGSKRNAKDQCNIREGFNGDRIKNISKLGTIPTHPGKEATKGDSILLGSGTNKDLDNFDSTDKETKSNTQKSVDSTTVVSNMMSTWNLKFGSSEGLKTMRKTPDASSLKISRNIGQSKDHSDATLRRELSSLRKSDKDIEVQGSTASKIVHPVQRKTSAITSLKRKTAEASNAKEVLLHPQKRLSQSLSESRNLKEPLERTVEVQCNQPENDTQTMLYNQPTSGLEIPNKKESSIFLTTEDDQNVEKAEEYAKELEDIYNMLKKKHEEAKELMVRAIVNNNHLLMLNHPMFDAKIQKVQKFAAQLVSN